ncbi:MAG: nucleoside deaminase [Clostridia bacterium]|nr:nucleoside deaminase [Clostridia bacterium]
MNKFMQMAIEEAKQGITSGHGGPFGSVIVKDGKVVAKGHNRVVQNNDPTCHGEVDAIRNACQVLGTFDLSGCEIYTTGEPCPMCLCACMWANISKIYYGCTIGDNAEIGFRDDSFYQKVADRSQLGQYLAQLDHEHCQELFAFYKSMTNKTNY